MSDKRIKVDVLPVDIVENAIYVINQPNPNSYTHNYFKYPCKFIPEIPRWAIKTYLSEEHDQLKILDPFAGSGTVLLESSLAGIDSYGTEIDEIAKLIIKVKTTLLSPDEISEVKQFAENISIVLSNNNYDKREVVLPQIDNLEHWFRDDILLDLGHLYFSITNLDNENVRNFLLLCMASIVKRVSNADDISPKPYVSNNIIKNPPEVSKTFLDITKRYLVGMEEMQGKELASVVVDGDATHIPWDDSAFDLAITSPPYINAFDYVRTLRLENLWLNLATEEELRNKKKQYVGTESIKIKDEVKNLDILNDSTILSRYYEEVEKVDPKRALVIKKFFEDMKDNIIEVKRSLKNGSKYIIVIGNSSIRNVDVESWKVLKEIAIGVGFKYINHFGYEILNPYIRIPRGSKGGKIAIDHILVLEK